ncbi:MAG TPA: hypothetical protein DCK99_06360 [Blastocatellia bacterium]|nr:hypothetical protein [Blastocatellia bacterium]
MGVAHSFGRAFRKATGLPHIRRHSRQEIKTEVCRTLLRNSPLRYAQEPVETKIGSQSFQTRIDADEGKSDGVLTFSFNEPAKRVVMITEQEESVGISGACPPLINRIRLGVGTSNCTSTHRIDLFCGFV